MVLPLPSSAIPSVVPIPATGDRMPEALLGRESLLREVSILNEGFTALLQELDAKRDLKFHVYDHAELSKILCEKIISPLISPNVVDSEALLLYLPVAALAHDLVQISDIQEHVRTIAPDVGSTAVLAYKTRERHAGTRITENEGATAELVLALMNPPTRVVNGRKVLDLQDAPTDRAEMFKVMWSDDRLANFSGEYTANLDADAFREVILATTSGLQAVKALSGETCYRVTQPVLSKDASLPAALMAILDVMGEVGTQDPSRFIETGFRLFLEMNPSFAVSFEEAKNWSMDYKIFYAQSLMEWLHAQRFFAETQRITFNKYMGLPATSDMFDSSDWDPQPVALDALKSSKVQEVLSGLFCRFESNRQAVIDVYSAFVMSYLGMPESEFVGLDDSAKLAAWRAALLRPQVFENLYQRPRMSVSDPRKEPTSE